jgi:hypothetical protein
MWAMICSMTMTQWEATTYMWWRPNRRMYFLNDIVEQQTDLFIEYICTYTDQNWTKTIKIRVSYCALVFERFCKPSALFNFVYRCLLRNKYFTAILHDTPTEKFHNYVQNVVITIFFDFRQFSAKKLAFFSITNVMIKILHNLALFWVETPFFLLNFSAKIFKKS